MFSKTTLSSICFITFLSIINCKGESKNEFQRNEFQLYRSVLDNIALREGVVSTHQGMTLDFLLRYYSSKTNIPFDTNFEYRELFVLTVTEKIEKYVEENDVVDEEEMTKVVLIELDNLVNDINDFNKIKDNNNKKGKGRYIIAACIVITFIVALKYVFNSRGEAEEAKIKEEVKAPDPQKTEAKEKITFSEEEKKYFDGLKKRFRSDRNIFYKTRMCRTLYKNYSKREKDIYRQMLRMKVEIDKASASDVYKKNLIKKCIDDGLFVNEEGLLDIHPNPQDTEERAEQPEERPEQTEDGRESFLSSSWSWVKENGSSVAKSVASTLLVKGVMSFFKSGGESGPKADEKNDNNNYYYSSKIYIPDLPEDVTGGKDQLEFLNNFVKESIREAGLATEDE